MTVRQLFSRSLICVCILVLAGCMHGKKEYNKTVDGVDNVYNEVRANENKMNQLPPPVVRDEGAYVDTTPVSLIHPPSWLKRKIFLKGNNMPFSFYVTQIFNKTGTIIHYGNSIDRAKLISMDYSGPLQGALNDLASTANYYYKLDNEHNVITWSAFMTKTFDVSFMPGSAEYMVGNAGASNGTNLASGGVGGGSSGGGSGDGSVSITYTGVDVTQDNQYSKLKGTVSVWTDLETTIKGLLSKDGQVNVSQATTTITVHDHPENVAAVGEYIKKMNEELSKQVRILVQVLEVTLSKNFNYGIDWNLVRNFGGSGNQLTLTGALASNANNTSTFAPIGITFASTSGKWSGSNSILQALEQQGHVSIVTQPTVTTLNNQVAQIAIQTQTGYLASTSTDALNDNTTSNSASPGVVTTGFNLYLLPKIQGDRIYLQVSSTLSNLISIDTINTTTGETSSGGSAAAGGDGSGNNGTGSGGSGSGGSGSGTNNNTTASPQIIQVPTVNERNFNQRSVIPTGHTLVLAGFKQINNQANKSGLFGVDALGAKGSSNTTNELVMLITPVILYHGDE